MQEDNPDLGYQRTVDPLWKKPTAKKAACQTCGSTLHTKTFCFQTRKKAVRKIGKQTVRWMSERKFFIERNRPDGGIWNCHYCGISLVEDKHNPLYISGHAMYLTIDHIEPRSGNPKRRYDMTNLVPCCPVDNRLKGSTEYIRFLERYYPEKLAQGF